MIDKPTSKLLQLRALGPGEIGRRFKRLDEALAAVVAPVRPKDDEISRLRAEVAELKERLRKRSTVSTETSSVDAKRRLKAARQARWRAKRRKEAKP